MIHIFNKLDNHYKIPARIKNLNQVGIRFKMDSFKKFKKLHMKPKVSSHHRPILRLMEKSIIHLKNLIALLMIFYENHF